MSECENGSAAAVARFLLSDHQPEGASCCCGDALREDLPEREAMAAHQALVLEDAGVLRESR